MNPDSMDPMDMDILKLLAFARVRLNERAKPVMGFSYDPTSDAPITAFLGFTTEPEGIGWYKFGSGSGKDPIEALRSLVSDCQEKLVKEHNECEVGLGILRR